MTDDELRDLLAKALWRIDTGGDSPSLEQASSSAHRTYLRAATDLLPLLRTIAAKAYGQGRDDEAAGLPIPDEMRSERGSTGAGEIREVDTLTTAQVDIAP